MYRLLLKTHGFLRNQSKSPKSLSPYSHFHSSKNTQISDSKFGIVLKEFEQLQSLKLTEEEEEEEEEKEAPNRRGFSSSEEFKVEISHPWPEWVELMELLLKKGYFGGSSGNLFYGGELGSKDSNRIRTACLNFARDRFDFIRYLCRKDIQLIVGSGCPSLDRKVVNSGKRLRAHVGIEEGTVCSSCYLRGSCERAYVRAREDEGGRTVDVMRILLTYGLDPFTGSVENKPCLNKSVKESVRRLLKEAVELSVKELDSNPLKVTSRSLPFKPEPSSSQQMLRGQTNIPMKQGDWICPKCNFLNFAKNIKCLCCDGIFQERLRKLGEGQDHLPLKKGDWLCDKCNFLNFAKNTKCLQCKEKPANRNLNPGEWECVSCNYVNFRRNMVCLKCDWKRPKASNYTDNYAQFQHKEHDHYSHSRMSFVKNDEGYDQRYGGPRRQIRNEETGFWSSGEDQGDDGWSGPENKFSYFEDFPIKGGQSVVSQNAHKREKWKGEMSKRSNFERGSYDDWGSAKFQRSLDFTESSDDDEMADWFGCGKGIQNTKL
ncbi:uncharacterized protein LOC143877724 [Tasmannia lanceolata]|uniref:uncharacterized protein LOC143877724 n=1 Tax=Tasmannia lanceolata TaxID=3420 RepID=UPI0040628717